MSGAFRSIVLTSRGTYRSCEGHFYKVSGAPVPCMGVQIKPNHCLLIGVPDFPWGCVLWGGQGEGHNPEPYGNFKGFSSFYCWSIWNSNTITPPSKVLRGGSPGSRFTSMKRTFNTASIYIPHCRRWWRRNASEVGVRANTKGSQLNQRSVQIANIFEQFFVNFQLTVNIYEHKLSENRFNFL